MTLALEPTVAVKKVVRRSRTHSTLFDNWYVHCPKCGGLLMQRMGSGGPAWVCLCPGRRAVAAEGEGSR